MTLFLLEIKADNALYNRKEDDPLGEITTNLNNWRRIVPAVELNIRNEFYKIRQSLEPSLRRDGGYFSLTEAINPECPRFVICVGEPPLEKWLKYFKFSIEKGRRLLEHPNHVSSFQSRNPDLEQFTGAVRWSDFAFSFSGMPEPVDEALMLNLLRTAHTWKNVVDSPHDEYLKHIASLSKNPYFVI